MALRRIFGDGARKWFFKHSGYNKYGLLHDDALMETEEVVEALRRLPQNIKDERNYRIQRAMQLCIENIILPEEQWTKYEEDVRYLQPYIDEVSMEMKEREIWIKSH